MHAYLITLLDGPIFELFHPSRGQKTTSSRNACIPREILYTWKILFMLFKLIAWNWVVVFCTLHPPYAFDIWCCPRLLSLIVDLVYSTRCTKITYLEIFKCTWFYHELNFYLNNQIITVKISYVYFFFFFYISPIYQFGDVIFNGATWYDTLTFFLLHHYIT